MKPCFSSDYERLRTPPAGVRESQAPFPEQSLQYAWREQLLKPEALSTLQGHRLRVISPGWWNHQAGPDFRAAQLEFNGRLYTGDVELHLALSDWKAHGHHLDPAYDGVILHVVFEQRGPQESVCTAAGRRVPTLILGPCLAEAFLAWPQAALEGEDPSAEGLSALGQCGQIAGRVGVEPVLRLVQLAGEWRMLNKARQLRERMNNVGADQAFYEKLLYACGFSVFKEHFQHLARALPYDRARQLAKRDPLLLETALLQLASLLPAEWPGNTPAPAHFQRLEALRREHLPGLKSLPLTFQRSGIRPNNYPERRLAGAARLVARTSQEGLAAAFTRIWKQGLPPLETRRAFEAAFPAAIGFWADHCTWTGEKMKRPAAPLGTGRIRSIIGNLLIPGALALARANADQAWEEQILAFYLRLPKEAENHIVRRMQPHLFGEAAPRRLSFALQQGLVQLYQDWCEHNPSCRACPIAAHLEASLYETASSEEAVVSR